MGPNIQPSGAGRTTSSLPSDHSWPITQKCTIPHARRTPMPSARRRVSCSSYPAISVIMEECACYHHSFRPTWRPEDSHRICRSARMDSQVRWEGDRTHGDVGRSYSTRPPARNRSWLRFDDSGPVGHFDAPRPVGPDAPAGVLRHPINRYQDALRGLRHSSSRTWARSSST